MAVGSVSGASRRGVACPWWEKRAAASDNTLQVTATLQIHFTFNLGAFFFILIGFSADHRKI